MSNSDNPHEKAAKVIVAGITGRINLKKNVYTITVAGESGSGKTETGKALIEELGKQGIQAVLLNQDNYFNLPPAQNDAQRKSDPLWLGPHVEVNMLLMQQKLNDAVKGEEEITVPVIDYYAGTRVDQKLSLKGIKAIIFEGTYVSLLKHVDCRIFITSTFIDTLPYRQKRNRGNEVHDSFVENILVTEHKIIAGHRYLADFLISKDCEVTQIN
ncbi:MAG: zeta toxin family protein [Lentimicrobium sp.]